MHNELHRRVLLGMEHLDSTVRGWERFTVEELTYAGDTRPLAQAVAVGGADALRKLAAMKGAEWCVRMGFLSDKAGYFGVAYDARKLDNAWRRLLVARVTR